MAQLEINSRRKAIYLALAVLPGAKIMSGAPTSLNMRSPENGFRRLSPRPWYARCRLCAAKSVWRSARVDREGVCIDAVGESDRRAERGDTGSGRSHEPVRRVDRESRDWQGIRGSHRAGSFSRHVRGIRSGRGMDRASHRRAISATRQNSGAAPPTQSQVAAPAKLMNLPV